MYKGSYRLSCECGRSYDIDIKESTPHNITIAPPHTGNQKLPTKEELWEHLKSLPTPPLDGSTVQHYVDAAHDFICRQLQVSER